MLVPDPIFAVTPKFISDSISLSKAINANWIRSHSFCFVFSSVLFGSVLFCSILFGSMLVFGSFHNVSINKMLTINLPWIRANKRSSSANQTKPNIPIPWICMSFTNLCTIFFFVSSVACIDFLFYHCNDSGFSAGAYEMKRRKMRTSANKYCVKIVLNVIIYSRTN